MLLKGTDLNIGIEHDFPFINTSLGPEGSVENPA